MKRFAALLALVAVARLGAAAPAGGADDAWTILPAIEPGTPFHDNEIPLHPAPGGLALTVVDGRWRLVPATVTGDWETPGQKYAITLRASPPDAPFYLHVPGLVAGKVDTPDMRFKGVTRELDSPSLAIAFKSASWRFETKGGAVTLVNGLRRQRLGDAPNDQEMRTVGLLWAGDLDRDGQLDFILQSTTDDDVTYCLWLSGHAGPNEIVGRAACMSRSS